ncbi:hypothetical protein UFOVP390_19 [uncultured Caudovirales phage]|uniref:Uncharacterized protein n=1 Tax=uncultured Caudovirales phage TaxID=2100421 RepID=A0A6J7X3P5_9CAUD|nr:hypothetical protein UFOVP390_19 [uncultured Caudovirales phage]
MAEYIEADRAAHLAAMQTEGVFKSRHKAARVWNGARAGALVHMSDGTTGMLLGWTGRSNWWARGHERPWFDGPIVYWTAGGAAVNPIWLGLHPQAVAGWTNP